MSKYASTKQEVVELPTPKSQDGACEVSLICGDMGVLYNNVWRSRWCQEKACKLSCFPKPTHCACQHKSVGKPTETKHRLHCENNCECWCHEQVIDVTKKYRLPRFLPQLPSKWGAKNLAMIWDEMPSPSEAKPYCRRFVFYATFIYLQVMRLQQRHLPSASPYNLSAAQSLVVHCRNGRSRSPTVLLVMFYLFYFFSFGEPGKIKRKPIIEHIKKMFRHHRPDITGR